MGYGDLGVTGALEFTTPNIDKLASEGMRFTNFHTVQAVCSASRAALLTGCCLLYTSTPAFGFPGHWAPMDIHFYTGDQFPERYKSGAFVAFHGSTDRSPYPQAGYIAVSYTHLDVYKRQLQALFGVQFKTQVSLFLLPEFVFWMQ